MKKDENSPSKGIQVLNKRTISFLKVGVVAAIFLDIIFIDKSHRIFQLFIFFLIIVILRVRKTKSFLSFKIFGMLLVLAPTFLILGFENVAEKTAIWTYMFLILGSVQMLVGLRREAISESKYS